MKLRCNLAGYGWLACATVWLAVHSSPAHAYLIKTTKTGHRVRWSSGIITMHVDPRLGSHLGKENVEAALTIATEAWRGLPNVPDVVISDRPAPGYKSNQHTNGIYFMHPWPFAKEQLAVTISTYDLDGHMMGADILVNGDSNYALLSDDGDHPGMAEHDLAAVLTHEMGHVLGLDESPDDQDATMWPYIHGGDVHQRTLTEDDESGIIEAYRDAVLDENLPSGCTQASVVGIRAHSSLLQLAGLFAVALWIGRRRLSLRRSRSLN